MQPTHPTSPRSLCSLVLYLFVPSRFAVKWPAAPRSLAICASFHCYLMSLHRSFRLPCLCSSWASPSWISFHIFMFIYCRPTSWL
ncbi:hypothetical protein BCR44DRAFT_1249602 [Catenaria anguillulae PL171]|uniref:Secreted protein n=1 Tax=Catenaria anguillulae PL171 TaxID=765915 RepID=A0A1Y2I0N4_9FUNG|nr:hypothetical protein BCR44DRAFT_1249602 [Catenaria anguillulae PL171]